LLRKHPRIDARLHVCTGAQGANGKVAKLAELERLARHPVLVSSDADVAAPPDLLAQLVAPLADPAVGLSNCLYRLANPANAAMRWEAVAINADFWSQVLQSRALKPMDFALGAVVALRRADLAALGGYATLRDFLADDFQLGRRIASRGQRIHLCPVVVDCRESPRSWREVWSHQLRWARTIRACRPGPYFTSLLANVTLWSLVWAVATLPFGWGLAQAFALLAIGGRIASAITLHRRLSPRTASWRDDWLVVLKDLLGAALWAGAFLGQTVAWRGQDFRIATGGKLESAAPRANTSRTP
jgi:ceramide glucosyltransferase